MEIKRGFPKKDDNGQIFETVFIKILKGDFEPFYVT